jgi:hypothetical protein
VVIFSLRWRWSGPSMGAARGRPVVTAYALCSGAGGGSGRLAVPGGSKGWMGRLAAGPIEPKVEGKFILE